MLFYWPITSLKPWYNTERHQVLTEPTGDWRSYSAYTTLVRNWKTWRGSKRRLYPLLWRHNGRDGVSSHQPHDCLRNRSLHQSSASLAFVRGIHMWPVNSPHKGSVTRKMFPFDDVIMIMPGNPLSNMILITPYSFKPKRIWHFVPLSICSS